MQDEAVCGDFLPRKAGLPEELLSTHKEAGVIFRKLASAKGSLLKEAEYEVFS